MKNLPNGGSQSVHIIFLTCNGKKCCPLVLISDKLKRVVRSTLVAEALALNEGCESAMYISKTAEELLKIEQIPILAIIDHKSLYEVLNSLTATSDDLLRVEIASIRQMIEIYSPVQHNFIVKKSVIYKMSSTVIYKQYKHSKHTNTPYTSYINTAIYYTNSFTKCTNS